MSKDYVSKVRVKGYSHIVPDDFWALSDLKSLKDKLMVTDDEFIKGLNLIGFVSEVFYGKLTYDGCRLVTSQKFADFSLKVKRYAKFGLKGLTSFLNVLTEVIEYYDSMSELEAYNLCYELIK